MHRMVNMFLSVVTLIAAIISAYYWFKSATVEPYSPDEPVASIGDNLEAHILATVVKIDGIHVALTRSATLNKRAAFWTGVSALLSAVTAIASGF